MKPPLSCDLHERCSAEQKSEMSWETVIGLEVHAQLKTQTKLFCRCSTRFGAEPNAHTCPVCLGLPGALPALNEKAVELAVRAGVALGCKLQERSQFARKNYFYPDLPKGYQISQYEEPYAVGGGLQVGENFVRLVRIHMEEDAGKSIHAQGDSSLVDYNRACTPLCEIVSEPDLRSAEEAAEYLKRLRQVLMALDVCDGNMEEGSFRCDANVSIRRRGEPLGTRVELKNINSFKFVTQAIHYEENRQREAIESGKTIVQETRLWDSEAKVTRSMRSKEDAMDYRYFPDPDLPPLVISNDLVARVKASQPELPHDKQTRYTQAMNLPEADARVLSAQAWLSRAFDDTVTAGADPKQAANFFLSVVLRDASEEGSLTPVPPAMIATLLALVASGDVSLSVAKAQVWPEMVASGKAPDAIIAEKGLAQVSDTGAIETAAKAVIDSNAKQAEGYRNGNDKLLGYFVGQVMKAMGGKANPGLVNEVVKRLLG
jgi:aspartyl-tRNA(Asn)/glutamyl-tRNA(Gln) amidotransferase subunit B